MCCLEMSPTVPQAHRVIKTVMVHSISLAFDKNHRLFIIVFMTFKTKIFVLSQSPNHQLAQHTQSLVQPVAFSADKNYMKYFISMHIQVSDTTSGRIQNGQ